jgi:L-iditol 2-dehydrogenase
MKSLVLVENGQLEVEERPVPERPGDNWVLVHVAAAGICGSDVPRAFDGGAYHYPLVMGHEFSGVVEESFHGSAFCPGDPVAIFPLIPNPEESINQVGEYAVARKYDYFGSRRDGGFQEYLWVPEFNLLPVPEVVALDHAAMTEPCAVALHAASRPRVTPGMSATVIGGGPIGNMVAQWLRRSGADPVIVSEPDGGKRSIAANMGFTVVDPGEVDPVEAVRDLTAGGADIAVEACGLPVTFRQTIAAAGLFGQVVFLGNIHGDFSLPEAEFSTLLRRELTIYGTWNSKVTPRGSDEWTRVLSQLGRGIDVDPLISHRISWEDGPSTFSAIRNREGWFNKVLFTDPELCK